MKYTKTFLFLMMPAMFTACGVEIRDKNQAPEEVHAQVRAEGWIPMSGNMFQIEEGLEPKSYRVKLRIPENVRFVERTDRNNIADRRRFWVDAREITDTDVQSGGSYEYAFHRTPSEKLASTTVHVPVDVVIDGPVAYNAIDLSKPIRRFYLGPKAVIQTGGANFEMRAERILAEPGARFETFAKGAVGGSSGGQVRLFIWKGIGELQIELRGQHGNAGANGAPHAGRAADGANHGSQRHRHCNGMGGGGAGANGATGHAGAPGQNGGATGSFEIEVTDDAEFKVSAVFEPGAAGPGGQGGAGQLGGNGGAGETRNFFIRGPRLRGPDGFGMDDSLPVECPRGPNGPAGTTGAPGPKGKDGLPGATGYFCLKVQGACRP